MAIAQIGLEMIEQTHLYSAHHLPKEVLSHIFYLVWPKKHWDAHADNLVIYYTMPFHHRLRAEKATATFINTIFSSINFSSVVLHTALTG